MHSNVMLFLPPIEVLYRICGFAVAEFLDSVIAGYHKYSPTPGNKSLAPQEDPVPTVSNPIIQLLRTSMKIRLATLLVVSDALGIPIDNAGVGR